MSEKIQIGNVELNYMMAGEGESILFINGFSTDLTIWSIQMAELAKEYRVVLFDNRGTGLSGKDNGNYSMERLADDVSLLLEKLNIPSVHLVGHSMGGLIAQHVAIRHPSLVKTLVLASTFLKAPKKGHLTFHLLPDILEKIGCEAFVDLVISQNYSSLYIENNYRKIILMRRLLINHLKQVPIDTPILRKLVQGILEHDTEKLVNKIQVPTLIIVGLLDKVFPPYLSKALAEKIPHEQLEVLDNCGHNLMLEQPEAFTRKIKEFIKSHQAQNQVNLTCCS